MEKTVWKLLSTFAALGAAWAAREAATLVWTQFSDDEAPVNPADRSISWPGAIGWAVLAGAAAGLARVTGRRGAAAAWTSVTGEAPPGLRVA